MSDYGVEIVGPFLPEHRIVVNGFAVPHLTAHKIEGTARWSLVCDKRFGVELDELDLHRVVWFMANAMAVAPGYSCHGENSEIPNPYKVRVAEITRG